GSKIGHLQVEWPADLVAYVGSSIYHYMNCLSAWMVIPNAFVIALLDTVRNRILSLALEIESEAPTAGEASPGTEPLPEQVVGHIFHTYILGGSNTIATGSSHFTQNSIYSVRNNDFDSLKSYLKNTGLAEDDLAELEL